MIFNALFKWKKEDTSDQVETWEVSEEPIYDYEAGHRETMEIIEDILRKLDEIKVLIDEMKNEDNKDV